jgi:hypothetical protein
MTKKDYELIAGSIKFSRTSGILTTEADEAMQILADDLSIQLANENPRFDRDKFLKACGLEEKCYDEHESGKYAGLSVPHYHD